jgi:nicotinamide-nucleotide amidase
MKAEIITIGDEILIGQTIDTNSAYMGKALNQIGITINRITSISDSKEEIIGAIQEAQTRCDLVIATGGLGPTRDDITKITLTEYFNTELITYPEIRGFIKDIFERRGLPILEVNLIQADLPKDCVIIPNKIGTASGMWFERNGKVVVSLPGVPYEMEYLMQHGVLDKIQETFETPTVIHKTVMTVGVGESFLADRIKEWEDSLDEEEIHIAYLPSSGLVKIRLSIISEEKLVAQERIDRKIMELLQIIPELVYGYDDQPLEVAIGELLINAEATLGTAESCTGGYLSHMITSVSGSSAYYQGSVISYSNEVKIKELSVKPIDLLKHGAVSKEVVEQMAKGLQKRLKVDYALATSGVAGPDGGSEEKPVGTVWIALATPNGKIISKLLKLEKNRGRNIHRSSIAALNLLRLELTRN